jgi:hypothetical protein
VTRFVAPVLALALGLTAAFWVASCGGSNDQGLLPGKTASDIVANLASVKEAASSGDCSAAESGAAEVQSQVEGLGPGVDPELRQRLLDGAAQLTALAEQCAVDTETTPETTVPETTAATDTTAPPETTKSTPTEPTDTTPTQPTEPTPTQPTEPTPSPPPPANGGGGSGSGGIGPGAQVGTP